MYLFFAVAVPWHFHVSPRQFLQLIEANRILERAVLMNLQHPWKSQGKIPSVCQLVEASAHQLHYKWMFEELGWLELLFLIDLDIELVYGDGKRHSFEVATPVEI